MKTWTGKSFASWITPCALFLGLAGCNVAADNPGAPTPPVGHPLACSATSLVDASSRFQRTSGPDLAPFKLVAATGSTVFASTGESLHRSIDEGATWSLVDADGLRGAQIAAIATLGSDVFVSVPAAAGVAGAIFRSTDAGVTWKNVATAECPSAQYLSVHGDMLFASAGGRAFRWSADVASFVALAFDPSLGFDVIESDGTYLYANSMYQPGVFRLLLDKPAETWVQVPDLPLWGYRAFAFDGKTGVAANATEMFRTTDGGASWKSVGPSAEVEDVEIAGGKVFAATSNGLVVSSDDGASWKHVSDERFTTSSSLAATSDHLFTASDAIRRSMAADPQPSPWERLHPIGDSISGLVATKNAVVAISNAHLLRSVDGGATWSEAVTGSVTVTDLIVHDGSIYALSNGQYVLESTDEGASFHQQPIVPSDGAWVNFLSADGAGLIAGITTGAGNHCTDVQDATTKLIRSTDGGLTWKPAMNGFPDTFTDCYGESYTPEITGVFEAAGALFATSFWKGTYRSTNGGAEWTPVAPPSTIGDVSSFAPIDDAVFAVASEGGIARSDDGGKTWISSGLASLHVASLLAVKGSLFATVAATNGPDAGVYTSDDLGATWVKLDGSFDSRVAKLASQGGRLFAGTLDQSVWSLPMTCAAD